MTMPRTALCALSVLVLSGSALAQDAPAPAATQPEAKAPAKPAKAPIYDENADARKVINAALAKAKAENRRVLIQWGANWCGWCHLLHETCKSDREIALKLMYEYDVVLVNVSEPGTTGFNKNMDLAKEYGADLKGTGIPYLTVLGADGKVITNQDTGALETKPTDAEPKPKPSHDKARVMEFLTKNQATYLQADAVLADARQRAAATGKSVMVRWGAPWCPWCHRLDDWLARPEVAALIDKDYVSVKIDQDRMVGGKELLAKEGGGKGGIPWFTIEDGGSGKVVITSDAEGQNIGFPSEPKEIAHFMTMLDKTAKKLTAADKDAIRKNLMDEKTKTDAASASHGAH